MFLEHCCGQEIAIARRQAFLGVGDEPAVFRDCRADRFIPGVAVAFAVGDTLQGVCLRVQQENVPRRVEVFLRAAARREVEEAVVEIGRVDPDHIGPVAGRLRVGRLQ